MSVKMAALVGVIWLCAGAFAPGSTPSEYLGNNQRTGYVDAEVPGAPVLLWTYHEKHPPKHAWEEPNREDQYIDFDYADQAAIGAGMVFFGSSADHKVYALDLASGAEKWTFYTEGPVRFAPVVHQDRVYAASDDGCLYCLNAATGDLIWKFRGGPSDAKLIGNDQMISHWPARSGVLVDNDRLYFTAGMWSRDGVFIYCLNPNDGSVIWKNDTSGFCFTTLPHAAGFAGVAPQGYLLLHRGMLYVPTGRGEPACFDARTGQFVFYENGQGYKPHQPGGSWVMAYKDWIIFKRRAQHTEESVRYEERDPAPGGGSGLFAIDYKTGEPQWATTDKNLAVANGDLMVLAGAGPVIKVDSNDLTKAYQQYWKDGKFVAPDPNIAPAHVDYVNAGIDMAARKGKGKVMPKPAWMSPIPFSKWSTDVGRVYFMLQARNTVLCGGRGAITALDSETGKLLWKKTIDGDARGICVADGCVVVSSSAGELYCFGAGGSDTGKVIEPAATKPEVDPEAAKLADAILRQSGIQAGYCLMLGAGDGRLLRELAERSRLTIYCLEPDPVRAAGATELLDATGLLGVRAAVHQGSLDKLPYNQYFANLIVWGDPLGSGTGALHARDFYRVLRPCGGLACQLAGKETASSTRQWLAAGGVPDSEASEASLGVVVKRGKLPGAGEWTHPYADMGRTSSSEDKLARLPLGMLWWGGPGPSRIVSRHWRAPVPLFANGIFYIQGQHDVIAVDAYNGREMWDRRLENVGRFPPFYRGGNIVADDESVFCIQGLACLRLDGQTGKTLKKYTFPLGEAHTREMAGLLANYPDKAGNSHVVWEFLGLCGNHVIGTLGNEIEENLGQTPYSKAVQQSKYLFAFDKTTGQKSWEYVLDRAVSPMAIVADGRSVYLLDRSDELLYQQAKRRGAVSGLGSSLKALDAATGKLLWEKPGIPLERKALMLKDGVIVAYPNPAERTVEDADGGVAVYSASDGKLLWEKEKLQGLGYSALGYVLRHSFIVGETLFLPWAYDLRTGTEQLLKKDPLTGVPARFTLPGKSFCGTVAAGEDLVTFRSASVGFSQIQEDSGSYWLPEVRPSCWISVIPAGGIVLGQEGQGSCICPYNYKTSWALAPVERNEDWSVYLGKGPKELREDAGPNASGKKAKRSLRKSPRATEVAAVARMLRANFNAPGDRMDSNGELWMAYPRPVSPTGHYKIDGLPIECQGEEGKFRYNSDYHTIAGTPDPWLYTSGVQGHLLFTVQASGNEQHTYTIRLHFAETEDVQPGGRVFDVKIQDAIAIPRLDVVKEAGAANEALVKEVKGVPANGTVAIELLPAQGKPPSICAFEILEE